jgi:hypothetical protein
MSQRPQHHSQPEGPPSERTPVPGARPSPLAALERARSVLGRLAGAAGKLALVALVAGAVIWWAVFRGEDVSGGIQVLLAVILLLPPVILLLFVVALRTLMSVPDRIRRAPAAVRDRMGEVRARLREVGERRGTLARLRSILALLWAIVSSRELVEVVGPSAVLLTPWMLVAAAVAAIGAVLELVVGLLALLWIGLA